MAGDAGGPGDSVKVDSSLHDVTSATCGVSASAGSKPSRRRPRSTSRSRASSTQTLNSDVIITSSHKRSPRPRKSPSHPRTLSTSNSTSTSPASSSPRSCQQPLKCSSSSSSKTPKPRPPSPSPTLCPLCSITPDDTTYIVCSSSSPLGDDARPMTPVTYSSSDVSSHESATLVVDVFIPETDVPPPARCETVASCKPPGGSTSTPPPGTVGHTDEGLTGITCPELTSTDTTGPDTTPKLPTVVSRTVYVKNLSLSTDFSTLKNLCSVSGEVTCVKIIRESDGTSRGFAFVTYKTSEEAVKAVNDLSGKELNGRSLFVGPAFKKSSRKQQTPQQDVTAEDQNQQSPQSTETQSTETGCSQGQLTVQSQGTEVCQQHHHLQGKQPGDDVVRDIRYVHHIHEKHSNNDKNIPPRSPGQIQNQGHTQHLIQRYEQGQSTTRGHCRVHDQTNIQSQGYMQCQGQHHNQCHVHSQFHIQSQHYAQGQCNIHGHLQCQQGQCQQGQCQGYLQGQGHIQNNIQCQRQITIPITLPPMVLNPPGCNMPHTNIHRPQDHGLRQEFATINIPLAQNLQPLGQCGIGLSPQHQQYQQQQQQQQQQLQQNYQTQQLTFQLQQHIQQIQQQNQGQPMFPNIPMQNVNQIQLQQQLQQLQHLQQLQQLQNQQKQQMHSSNDYSAFVHPLFGTQCSEEVSNQQKSVSADPMESPVAAAAAAAAASAAATEGHQIVDNQSGGNPMQSVNLYVKHLDYDVNDLMLKNMFSKYGEVLSAKVMMEGDKSRGFGFVCFAKAEDATRAIKDMRRRNDDVTRKQLYVAPAQRKEERQALFREKLGTRDRKFSPSPSGARHKRSSSCSGVRCQIDDPATADDDQDEAEEDVDDVIETVKFDHSDFQENRKRTGFSPQRRNLSNFECFRSVETMRTPLISPTKMRSTSQCSQHQTEEKVMTLTQSQALDEVTPTRTKCPPYELPPLSPCTAHTSRRAVTSRRLWPSDTAASPDRLTSGRRESSVLTSPKKAVKPQQDQASAEVVNPIPPIGHGLNLSCRAPSPRPVCLPALGACHQQHRLPSLGGSRLPWLDRKHDDVEPTRTSENTTDGYTHYCTLPNIYNTHSSGVEQRGNVCSDTETYTRGDDRALGPVHRGYCSNELLQCVGRPPGTLAALRDRPKLGDRGMKASRKRFDDMDNCGHLVPLKKPKLMSNQSIDESMVRAPSPALPLPGIGEVSLRAMSSWPMERQKLTLVDAVTSGVKDILETAVQNDDVMEAGRGLSRELSQHLESLPASSWSVTSLTDQLTLMVMEMDVAEIIGLLTSPDQFLVTVVEATKKLRHYFNNDVCTACSENSQSGDHYKSAGKTDESAVNISQHELNIESLLTNDM